MVCARAAFFTGLVLLALPTLARAQDCNAPMRDVVTTVNLPGEPAGSIVPTKDGCTIFVALDRPQDPATQGHIVVLRRAAGKVTLVRDIPIPMQYLLGSIALSHDGKWLAAANLSGVLLFDAARLMEGDGKPLVEAKGDPKKFPGSNSTLFSPDDRLLFVTNEGRASITVYDLAKLRGGDTTPLGQIPVGSYPTGAEFSPDGRKLYVASQEDDRKSAPATCPGEDGSGDPTRQGVLVVADVARAATDPAGSVLVRVPGGCDPVRAAVSRDGRHAFVTNRSANTLRAFDTAKLISDPDHALVATVPVGPAPVGIAAAGPYIFTSDSNRFVTTGRKGEWLSVIDPATFKVVGNIPTGLFPRTLGVTADGKTLLVPNSNSDSFGLVDLARLTPAYFAQEKRIKDADDAGQAKIQAALKERIKNRQPDQGAEAALRHIIDSYEKGKPDYDALLPENAMLLRMRGDRLVAQFQTLGALQSITFKSADQNGRDTFEAAFEHARTEWRISLSPDGKAATLGFKEIR